MNQQYPQEAVGFAGLMSWGDVGCVIIRGISSTDLYKTNRKQKMVGKYLSIPLIFRHSYTRCFHSLGFIKVRHGCTCLLLSFFQPPLLFFCFCSHSSQQPVVSCRPHYISPSPSLYFTLCFFPPLTLVFFCVKGQSHISNSPLCGL